ncbi:unnamed protein product [Clonostachys rhizophaga]|uniref:Uncharacterized protein n=1 Tax=Clonostachys rhizophaga TaxID=160324 RepID=A0A9N9VEI4_9HYPO|nr:unnamed protein product [Clonostachys rhizophaga]
MSTFKIVFIHQLRFILLSFDQGPGHVTQQIGWRCYVVNMSFVHILACGFVIQVVSLNVAVFVFFILDIVIALPVRCPIVFHWVALLEHTKGRVAIEVGGFFSVVLQVRERRSRPEFIIATVCDRARW